MEDLLEFYKEGKLSVDKAAKIAGLTVRGMMDEIAKNNIISEETIKEYRNGIKILMESE